MTSPDGFAKVCPSFPAQECRSGYFSVVPSGYMTDSNHSLTRRRLLQAAAATWFLSVSRVGFAASAQVIAVRVWPSSTYTRVTLESSHPLKYKQFALSNPDRIVVDIQGVHLNSVLKGIGHQVQGAILSEACPGWPV